MPFLPSIIGTMVFYADIVDGLNILRPVCDKSKALMRLIPNKCHFLSNDLIEIRNIGFGHHILYRGSDDIFFEDTPKEDMNMLFKTATISGFNVLSPACDRSKALLQLIPNRTDLSPRDLLNVEDMGFKWSVTGEAKYVKHLNSEMAAIRLKMHKPS